jgi:hypothetical protein
MCYTTVFSTTSDEDFSKVQSPYMQCGAPKYAVDDAVAEQLSYPHHWVLISRFGGCSCHFRHDMNGWGFGPAEEWMDEDPDDAEATMYVYDLLYRIVAEGHQLDILDVWEGQLEGIRNLLVELDNLPRDHFRFQDGSRMELRFISGVATTGYGAIL